MPSASFRPDAIRRVAANATVTVVAIRASRPRLDATPGESARSVLNPSMTSNTRGASNRKPPTVSAVAPAIPVSSTVAFLTGPGRSANHCASSAMPSAPAATVGRRTSPKLIAESRIAPPAILIRDSAVS